MSDPLSVCAAAASGRPFHGLGFQADCVLYNELNRQAGVGEEDYQLVESRIRALQPGVVRVFIPIDLFNPSFDARSYVWDSDDWLLLLRHLRNLQAAGAKVNVCMGPTTNAQMCRDGAERAAVDLVARLRGPEGLDSIAWLTLFNEPDSIYRHDSPLYGRIFGDKERPTWQQYVAKHVAARRTMEEAGLCPAVRLVVADTVWGHPMRRERMEISARDFADLDVAMSYHNYNPEWPEYYESDDYRYPGIVAEAEMFRGILGPQRELMLWEYNSAGPGFGAFFPGTGRHGEDLLGSYDNAVEVCDKTLQVLLHGVDGACLWCIGDMFYYGGMKIGPMQFGLFRYKWYGWRPRPYYYYYAALCQALRAGSALHRIDGLPATLNGVATKQPDQQAVVLLNRSMERMTVALSLPGGATTRLRVHSEVLPTPDGMPVSASEDIPCDGQPLKLELLPRELTVLRMKD